jgi:hypothetical protein
MGEQQMQEFGHESGTRLPRTGQIRRKGPFVLLPTLKTGFALGRDVADDLLEDDVDVGPPRAALGGEHR